MATLKTLARIIDRSQDTLLHDAMGAGALMIILLVGLHLPSLI